MSNLPPECHDCGPCAEWQEHFAGSALGRCHVFGLVTVRAGGGCAHSFSPRLIRAGPRNLAPTVDASEKETAL